MDADIKIQWMSMDSEDLEMSGWRCLHTDAIIVALLNKEKIGIDKLTPEQPVLLCPQCAAEANGSRRIHYEVV